MMSAANSNKIINIIISKTALNDITFKESVDLALVCAAFDQTVNLIFIEQGVCNLIKSQDYHQLKDKNHLEILKGLEFYDIENIYAEKESLDALNLNSENLIEHCEVLNSLQIKNLHRGADALVNL